MCIKERFHIPIGTDIGTTIAFTGARAPVLAAAVSPPFAAVEATKKSCKAAGQLGRA